jgi:hypothetical protein
MSDEASDPLFEALWSRVLEAWDDDKTHNALLEYAIRAEKLPEAAGRYRTLVSDVDKGERAKKRLDAIVIAATSMLMATKTPKRQGVPWFITLSAFLIALVLIGWVAYAMFYRR